MSHYTVMIVTADEPSKPALDAILAPFDENERVPRYKSYETGGPAEHWFARSAIKEGKLPEDAGWAQIVEAYNAEYHAGESDKNTRAGLFEPDVDEDRMHIDEQGAYTWSTYNPQSKWDWWVIGGRWPESLLHIDGHRLAQLRRGELDIARMRGEAELDFRREAEVPREIWRKHGYLTWAQCRDKAALDDSPIDAARALWRGQPAMAEYVKHDRDGYWAGEFLDRVMTDDDEYERQVKIAVAAAVPCYATITLDRKWMAPGTMGWWAMSTDDEGDRIGYYEAMNAMIENLDPDCWLTVVDCHI